jgi:phosphoglycerate dehydrogenase-like enzyme
VRGIARHAGERVGYPVVAESEAQGLLPTTDVLVSLVPSAPSTVDLFDKTVFDRLKRGSIFINVGRGATVDEDALIDALTSNQLRAAAIDVTKSEPLEASSALWATPNLIITPHVAGNRPVGATELVQTNIERLRAGGDLINLIST